MLFYMVLIEQHIIVAVCVCVGGGWGVVYLPPLFLTSYTDSHKFYIQFHKLLSESSYFANLYLSSPHFYIRVNPCLRPFLLYLHFGLHHYTTSYLCIVIFMFRFIKNFLTAFLIQQDIFFHIIFVSSSTIHLLLSLCPCWGETSGPLGSMIFLPNKWYQSPDFGSRESKVSVKFKVVEQQNDSNILTMEGEIVKSSYVSTVPHRIGQKKIMGLNIKLKSLSTSLNFWIKLVLSIGFKSHHAPKRTLHFSPTTGIKVKFVVILMLRQRCHHWSLNDQLEQQQLVDLEGKDEGFALLKRSL